MLAPLRLPPGLLRNGTRYQAKNRWYAANLVRFMNGTILPVGGWSSVYSSAVNTTVGVDTFTYSGADISLKDNTPDSGITHWEYGGVANTWQVEGGVSQQRTYRANASGGFGSIARTTNNLTTGTGGVQLSGTLHRAGVDGSGETGYVLHNNGALAKTVVDGLLVTFLRVNASTVDTRLYTFVNGTKVDDISLPTLLNLSWTSSPEEEKVVTILYNHPTVTITVGATTASGLVTQNMTSNGSRYGMFSDAALNGSAGWRFNDITITSIAAPTAVNVAGVPRAIVTWQTSGGRPYFAVGSTEKLMAYSEGVLTDITPSGFTIGNEDASEDVGGATYYGSGYYGANAYGMSQPLTDAVEPPDIWQLDTFGEYLVGVMYPSDGHLYVWPLSGIAAPASGAPVQNRGVVTTPERFLVALGSGDDPRALAWASQESTTDWTPSGSNTAGDWSLETNGQIVAGRRGNGETLIWTDQDLHRMTYIGGTLVYGFAKCGFNCGLIAPNAVARYDTSFAWMGLRSFYTYNGYVRDLPCDVSDGVFADFNYEQRAKVSCFLNVEYGEIWWFYPSANSTENDRYCVWNWRENHWNMGTLARTCGVEMSASFRSPLLCAPDGAVYSHELGFDKQGAEVYAESGPVEIGDGDRIMHVTQLVPDENTTGDVEATFYTRFEPNGTATTVGPYALSAMTPVRFAGREAMVRLDEVNQVSWRVGILRLDATEGGRR